jgi:hypothetical protein
MINVPPIAVIAICIYAYAKSENEIQTSENELQKIANKYDMKIFSSKTKTIEFCGKKHTKGKNRN